VCSPAPRSRVGWGFLLLNKAGGESFWGVPIIHRRPPQSSRRSECRDNILNCPRTHIADIATQITSKKLAKSGVFAFTPQESRRMRIIRMREPAGSLASRNGR
jgi:hypothetical protein